MLLRICIISRVFGKINHFSLPFFEILQMSDGSIRETRGSQLVKSHFKSTTKSPRFFKDLIISGFLCFNCSLDWCWSFLRRQAIIWRSPKLKITSTFLDIANSCYNGVCLPYCFGKGTPSEFVLDFDRRTVCAEKMDAFSSAQHCRQMQGCVSMMISQSKIFGPFSNKSGQPFHIVLNRN